MDVFDLMAKLSLDSSEYDKGLSDASDGASKFGKGLKTAFKVGGAAIAATAAAITGVTTALVKGAGDVASYGDNIDKMSQKMGLSAEAYQEWDAILQHSGSSIESMKGSMKTLANAVESGNEAFERIGLTQEQIASMSQEELFSATISGLQQMEDVTERTYVASQLLGRGATELGALLNTSAEDTEAMRQRVHELGGVMSDEGVKAAAHYQDSLQDMQTAFSGLQRNMMGEFLPSITTIMDGLTELFAGRGGLELISEGVKSFVGTLSDSIPQIMETGSGIILALVEAIVENLPTLLDAAVQAIMTIATGLVEQLPTIVKAGFDILLSLIQGIVDNLPELIPATIDVILEIIDTLTNPKNLGMLVDASIAIIIALANGMIDALPRLIEKAPEIVMNLVTALIENAPKLFEAALEIVLSLVKSLIDLLPRVFEIGGEIISSIAAGIITTIGRIWDVGKEVITSFAESLSSWDPLQWGKDLVSNFIDGIKRGWENLKSGVSDVAQGIKNFLGFSEPKEGPLSNFHTYAPDMMAMFAQGIRDNEHLITDQLSKSFDFSDTLEADSIIKSAPVATQKPVVPSVFSSQGGEEKEIVINLTAEMDGTVMARKMFRLNQDEAARHGDSLVSYA